MTKMTWREALRALRTHHTQQWIADRVRVSVTSVAVWDRGEATPLLPFQERLIRLAGRVVKTDPQ